MASNRQEYIDKINARIDQASAELDRLKAKAREAETDVKIRIQNEVDQLNAKRNAAEQELEQLKQSSDAAREDFKTGAESAWRNLSDSVKRASEQFS